MINQEELCSFFHTNILHDDNDMLYQLKNQ